MTAQPELLTEGETLIYRWPEAEIEVDRYASERETVTAELTIWARQPVTAFLHRCRLNLLATPSKNTLAKHLSSLRAEVDWYACVEYAALLTINRLREGEPWVVVGELEPRETPRYALHPILPADQATILYGPGGVGKSTLLDAAAVALASGRIIGGLQPATACAVLLLDWEADAYDHQEVCNAIARGIGLGGPPPLIYHQRCHQPLAEMVDELVRRVAREQIGLVGIDSLNYACGGNPLDPDIGMKAFRAIRRLRCTALAVDHVAKEHNTGPFGTVVKYNSARAVWEVRQQSEEGAAVLQIGLFNTKRNRAARTAPLGMEVTFIGGEPPEEITFRRIDVRDVPQLAGGATLKSRIERELAGGSLSVKTLSSELDVSEGELRVILNRWKDRAFVKVGENWGLAARNGA